MSVQTLPSASATGRMPAWETTAAWDVLRWPVPTQGAVNRWLLRAVALAARGRVLRVSGLEHIDATKDPFILVLNHSTRIEAVLVPALLMLHRGGRVIHFMADWNFALIPGVGLLYRRAGTLTVTAKPAKPRVLDWLRPLYRPAGSVLDLARGALAQGHPIGLFPEGTVNRDPHRLLAGRRSAALLALETGVPVVPAGIRFPEKPSDRLIRDRDPMEIRIGPPLAPPPAADRRSGVAVRTFHAALMSEIARLSGKRWTDPDTGPEPRGGLS